MEKLLELLNEFEKEKEYNKAEWKVSDINQLHYKYVVSDTLNGEGFSKKYLSRDVSKAYLISSECSFIEWLVENDKINTNNLSLKAFKNIFSGGGFVEVSDLEVLLMLLSISSSPIDDLLSYLN